MPTDLMTLHEAAQYLRIDPLTFSQWLTQGKYSIPVTRVGHLPRFRREYLDRWLKSRTVVRRGIADARSA